MLAILDGTISEASAARIRVDIEHQLGVCAA
jgi:hypothetical protein